MKVSRALPATVVTALVVTAGPLAAQDHPADMPGPALRLTTDSLTWRSLPVLAPGGRLGLRVPPAAVAARWEQEVRTAWEHARQVRRTWFPSPHAVAREDPPVPEPALPPIRVQDPAALPPLDALARYADLGLEMTARFEMKVDRFRNLRCTPADAFNPASACRASFPTPALDQQFNVRAGGIVGERIHVNVDYDSEREFSANNNINVWYEGLEDEILRRVEVGNVSFAAPPSRFITAAVPANSFGVQAAAQFGPLEVTAVLAQQRGSQLRSRVYVVGEEATQPVDREIRDLDFEVGRFFFVVDPRLIPGFPALDMLNVAPELMPASIRPSAVRVYRLRAHAARAALTPDPAGIDAIAVRRDGAQRVGPFPWEQLIEGRDYYLDPSASWFALATRVGDEDFLAVSYITAGGDTVGTFPSLQGTGDTLELVYEPRRGPDVPTFFHEIRNVYRVGGGDVRRETVNLTLTVNESERPLSGDGTYLALLGLARRNDPSSLDEFNRIFPRPQDPAGGAPIRDLFVVFPHLQPFADQQLAAAERNDSLYRTPAYLLRTQGPPPRFRIRIEYEATGAGDRSTLDLGAFQVRERSERLFIGATELVRDRDYRIVYDLGRVIFLNPDSLFRGPTQIEAQFEEHQVFDLAPRSVLGLTSSYSLGSRGQLHATALFQRENSVLTRPQLGFEPQATFIGGLGADLAFPAEVVTRWLDALPMVRTDVPSRLTFNAEMAVSRPNPNQAGQAYLEEFEGAAFRTISLLETGFQLGSRPESGAGLSAAHLGAGGVFDSNDAVPMIWQNIVQMAGSQLQFEPRDIDTTIRLTGVTRQVETVLWLTLKSDTVGGAPDRVTGAARWIRPHVPGPRWRSASQPLGGSGLGMDLERTEFLEFWVLEDGARTAREQDAVLVFDFGTVFEDAVAFGPESFRVVGPDTVFSGFRFLGQGELDTERDPVTNVWNAAIHDVGIHGDLLPDILNEDAGEIITDFPTCELNPGTGVPVFPLGHLAARCTRRNGVSDTEDLNGDNRLDVTVGTVQEDVFRYVFPIGDERYFVRTGVTHLDAQGRTMTWRLYRIPFREDTVQIGSPNIRQIRAVRMTLVAPYTGGPGPEFSIALGRMRLVGAPWVKRDATPIAGISGGRGEPHGEVIASVVTTEDVDLGYEPPPGVLDLPDRRGAEFDLAAQQINETSLRLLARDLRLGERAEAFIRFAEEGGRNFLRYRTLRVWARGRGVGWGERDLEFFIKAGRDEHNFYMYRAPARSDSWEPEVVIDLDRWLRLRAEIEAAWLAGSPPGGWETCGGDSTAWVACDGPYVVHVRDPDVAPPNLARVSEMAVGMYRAADAVFIEQAELWVDDIRLSDVVAGMGLAAAIDARLTGADVIDLHLGMNFRDSHFRQIADGPSYATDRAVRAAGTLRTEKLLPSGLGISAPLSVQHTRTGADPFYVSRTDILADDLSGLRRPRSVATSWHLAIRRVRRGTTFVERNLADPLSFQATALTSQAASTLSDARTTHRQFRLDYNNQPGARTVSAVPRFVSDLVDRLPGPVRDSEFGRSLRTARLRWNPFQLRAGVTYTSNSTERQAFRAPVVLASDTMVPVLRSLVHTLRSEAGIDFRPFNTLALRIDYVTTRDLQDYGDSTTLGRLLGQERRALLGRNVGFEQGRTLSTALNVTPVVASWVRPRVALTSTFSFTRDPNGIPVRTEPDSSGAFRPPEAFGNSRRRELGVSVTPGALVAGLLGAESPVTQASRRILPIDLAHMRERRSGFNRAPFAPGFGYQLGLGGLDEFRMREGVPATTASETETRTASGGAQLPLGLTMRANYRDTEIVTWLRRAGVDDQMEIVQRSREWPSGSITWVYSPRWFLRHAVSSVSAAVQGRRSLATTELAGTATESRTTSVAPSITVTWSNRIVTGGQYTRSETDQITSGNRTHSVREDWGGNVSFSFRSPRSILELPNEIQTTLAAGSSTTTICLERRDAETCAALSDNRRRAVDVRMDTGFSPSVRGGASLSYVLTEQRHTFTKFSQTVFNIFAEVFFVSGQL